MNSRRIEAGCLAFSRLVAGGTLGGSSGVNEYPFRATSIKLARPTLTV
jgi:hypothetical protein